MNNAKMNKSIRFFTDDCDSAINVTLSKLEAAQMLAVAIIRKAVWDVIHTKTYCQDAAKWLQSNACENLLDLLGTNISGKDILKMAIKLKNERNKSNESTSHFRQARRM